MSQETHKRKKGTDARRATLVVGVYEITPLQALDPFWTARSGQPFGTYLTSRSAEAAEALLGVTDQRAANPDHAALAKIYNGIRPKAQGMVASALPRLGAAVESVAT